MPPGASAFPVSRPCLIASNGYSCGDGTAEGWTRCNCTGTGAGEEDDCAPKRLGATKTAIQTSNTRFICFTLSRALQHLGDIEIRYVDTERVDTLLFIIR